MIDAEIQAGICIPSACSVVEKQRILVFYSLCDKHCSFLLILPGIMNISDCSFDCY